MNNMTSRATVLLATVALLSASACAKGSVEVVGQVDENNREMVAQSSLTLADGTLVVDSAEISVSEIEIEGGSEWNEREAEFGGATIPLSLDGSATQVISQSVDTGEYHTVGIELRRSNAIRVQGTWQGEPFEFTSNLNPEVEFPIRPAINVTEDGASTVSIEFDVASWFTDEDGNVIDPTDPANQRAIDRNILSSMTAQGGEIEWEDDDDD